MNKLDGFPSVYYLSLEESEDRRKHLSEQFNEYKITNLNGVISKRFAECDDIVEGNYVHTLTNCSKGANTSQLRCLKKWLNETNEEYGFFCEDDLSLKTVEYWNFTWKEFINALPSDWDAVQLMTIRESFGEIKFGERQWDDWSAAAYIIKRDYAKKLVEHYYSSEKFVLNVLRYEDILQPITENVLFAPGKTYNVPLFVEEVYKFNATFINSHDFNGFVDGDQTLEGQGKTHITSHNKIVNWWKNNHITLEKLMNIPSDPVTAYALDTENPQKNYELARFYHTQKQTAAAITYYLRAADRTDDLLLAYECLLHMASCFNDQKNRNYTVRGLYQQAINLLPRRPEAYFLYARYDEWHKMYADGYTTANLGLTFCDFYLEPLSNVDYPGKYGLVFEKAVCSYWWGKSKECKELFLDLKNNPELDEIHKIAVKDNIIRLKI